MGQTTIQCETVVCPRLFRWGGDYCDADPLSPVLKASETIGMLPQCGLRPSLGLSWNKYFPFSSITRLSFLVWFGIVYISIN